MSVSEYLSPLVGRWVLAWYFLSQVIRYGGAWEQTILDLKVADIPAAPLVLVFVLTLLILGSLSLIFGFHVRHGAMLLFAVTLSAALLQHAFWRIGDPTARAGEFELFALDLAVAGGLLLLVGMGPGTLALDNRMGGGGKKKK
jgi:putative oxidoreductase